jgi:hypothetical protein
MREGKRARIGTVKRWLAFVVAGLCCSVGAVTAQERPVRLDAAVHALSSHSSGLVQIEVLARDALARGFEVLILTDADVMRVDYGLPFLRNLLRFSESGPALLADETLEEYLAEIRRVDAAVEGLILIDGIESRPFYYWDGILSGGPWQLQHWNKRLIAIGLESAEAYAGLPVSGSGGIWGWHWTSILLLWPLAGGAYALLMTAHPLVTRVGVGVVSLLCLIDNAPFKVPLWDAYKGDLGPAPYQCYIDAVNERGGLVFWVEPDRREIVELFGGRIGAICPPSSITSDLVHTFDYAGFAALHQGRGEHAEPGRAWDRALGQYLRRERERPVWGIGDADYRGGVIQGARTVVLVSERSRRGVLEALRAGRMYAAAGPDGLELEEFTVLTDRTRGGAGQHLESGGPVSVKVRVGAAAGEPQQLRLRLVRSGKVVAQFTGTTPLEFTHVDEDLGPGQRTYFRLLAYSQNGRLVSNPIFVRGASR